MRPRTSQSCPQKKSVQPLFIAQFGNGAKETFRAYNMIWAWKRAYDMAKRSNTQVQDVIPAGPEHG